MKVVHYDQVQLEPVYAEGAESAQIRWLIAQKDGAPNFALRMFEVAPQGTLHTISTIGSTRFTAFLAAEFWLLNKENIPLVRMIPCS